MLQRAKINFDKNDEILHTKKHNFFSKPDVVHDDTCMNTDMADIYTIKCVDWSKPIVTLGDKTFVIFYIMP